MSIVLHDFPLSANCYRVRLLLGLLGLAHEVRQVDLLAGHQRAPAFLALNPVGQVPVLVDEGSCFADSHVIALHLAETHGPGLLLPRGVARWRVLEWLFFDANELHNGIGLARNFFAFGVGPDGEFARERGIRALRVMEAALVSTAWLAGDAFTLADVACYPLTTVLADARIDPAPYPAIADWQRRIERQPGYLAMQ